MGKEKKLIIKEDYYISPYIIDQLTKRLARVFRQQEVQIQNRPMSRKIKQNLSKRGYDPSTDPLVARYIKQSLMPEWFCIRANGTTFNYDLISSGGKTYG